MDQNPNKVTQIFNLNYLNWLGLRQRATLTGKNFSEIINEALQGYLAKQIIKDLPEEEATTED